MLEEIKIENIIYEIRGKQVMFAGMLKSDVVINVSKNNVKKDVKLYTSF